MTCSHFRRQHLAYLDDTLPGDLMAAAQRHLLQCDPCAAFDTRIRRALMVARSLPAIAPRADFRDRLNARLAARPRPERPSALRPLTAMAASAVLGALAWQLFRSARPPVLALQPVLAARSPAQAVPLPPLPPSAAAYLPIAPDPIGTPLPAAGFLPVRATHPAF